MLKKVLFIILARKGSKRLKNKNILLFNNKPLVCWTIEQAIRLKHLANEIVVSTDCPKIIKHAEKYKEAIVIRRPKYLSKGSSSSLDAIKQILKKKKYDGNIILLQPTSPLRQDEDIISVHNLLFRGYSPIMSVSKALHNSSLMFYQKVPRKLKPVNKKKIDIFYPNGAIYAAHSRWINKNNTFYKKEIHAYEMDQSHSIDIDLEYQFIMAEAYFSKLNN